MKVLVLLSAFAAIAFAAPSVPLLVQVPGIAPGSTVHAAHVQQVIIPHVVAPRLILPAAIHAPIVPVPQQSLTSHSPLVQPVAAAPLPLVHSVIAPAPLVSILF